MSIFSYAQRNKKTFGSHVHECSLQCRRKGKTLANGTSEEDSPEPSPRSTPRKQARGVSVEDSGTHVSMLYGIPIPPLSSLFAPQAKEICRY